MNKLEVYKCEHCNNVYQFKETCLMHEKKCNMNPVTRSCGSCNFSKKEYYRHHLGFFIPMPLCMRNHDLTEGSKTSCNDYHSKEAKIDLKLLQDIKTWYDPTPFIQTHIKKYLLDEEKFIQFLSEEEDNREKFSKILTH